MVAALAAGFAIFPSGGGQPPASANAVPTPVKIEAPLPVVPPPVAAKASVQPKEPQPFAPVKQPRRAAEPRVDLAAATTPAPVELKAAKPAKNHGCECESAELNLPAICPDGACRQCKITCGIPGN